jgi:hypothetical protein
VGRGRDFEDECRRNFSLGEFKTTETLVWTFYYLNILCPLPRLCTHVPVRLCAETLVTF